MASWDVVLRDRMGGFLAPVTVPFKVRRGLDEATHVSFTVDHEDEAAYKLLAELTLGIPQVALWRDGVLWARGWWHPMEESAGEGTSMGCVFRGPFAELENRFLRTTYGVWNITTATWGPKTADQADHVMALAGMDEATYDTGLFRGTVVRSQSRDRLYEPRKQRAEAILQLTEVIDGVEFLERPVEQTANSAGKPMLAHLDAGGTGQFGTDKSASVIFEHGFGASNVLTVNRQIERPVNWVYAIGGEYEDNGPQRRSVTVSNQASIDKYGLHELVLDLPDVYYTATLAEHASGLLRPDPPQAVTFTPDASGDLQPTNYWIGDTIRLIADRAALQLDMTARIRAVEIEVDADGNETHTLEIGDQRARPLVDMLRGLARTQRALARQLGPKTP